MPADTLERLRELGHALEVAAPPITFAELRGGRGSEELDPRHSRSPLVFTELPQAVPASGRRWVLAVAACLLIVVGVAAIVMQRPGGTLVTPPANARRLPQDFSLDPTVHTTTATTLPGAETTLPGFIVIEGFPPPGSTLRFVKPLPAVGGLQVYDTEDRLQVCFVLYLDPLGETMHGCNDVMNVNSGTSWFMIQGTARTLLWGMTATDIDFRAVVDGATVAADSDGVWYVEIRPDLSEFSISTSVAGTVTIDLTRDPLQTTVPPAATPTG